MRCTEHSSLAKSVEFKKLKLADLKGQFHFFKSLHFRTLEGVTTKM